MYGVGSEARRLHRSNRPGVANPNPAAWEGRAPRGGWEEARVGFRVRVWRGQRGGEENGDAAERVGRKRERERETARARRERER